MTSTELAPVIDDLNAYILTGRVSNTGKAITDGVDAERLGFKRLFMSERFDLKEAGALLGGVAARTSRIEIGTGAIIAASRTPLMTAALGATMQTAYGHRFNLGLGRGNDLFLKGQGIGETKWDAYRDYVAILRRLWAGETVTYDGPAGSYESLKLVDPLQGPPPPVWVLIFGGPVGCRHAAEIGDAVLLSPFMTPEAVHNTVTTIRAHRERMDLDPDIPICHPIVTAPDLDEDTTLRYTAARLVTYLQLPDLAKIFRKLNHWDDGPIQKIIEHKQFRDLPRANVDQSFHLSQLSEPARLVPWEWVEQTAAVGSIDDCVATLQRFRDAGATELAIYGSDPIENAALAAAWRERNAVTV